MLRIGRTVGAVLCGTAVALLAAVQPAEAQPAEAPADAQRAPNGDPIDSELAELVWQYVLPDVLTPLPQRNARPAQLSYEIVRSGDVTLIARAQRDFERRNDATLRELHESISYAERQALRAYVDAARIELPQLRRDALVNAACHGKTRSGLDLAAAHIAADALHSERTRQVVADLANVLDADSFDRVLARAMGADGRVHGPITDLVSAEARTARYSALSRDALMTELRRICGGVWSYHSDAKPA